MKYTNLLYATVVLLMAYRTEVSAGRTPVYTMNRTGRPAVVKSLSPQQSADIQAAVTVADFLAMYPVSETDRQQLRQELLRSYATDKASDPKLYPTLRQLAQTIAQARRNGLTMAALRGPLQQRFLAVIRAYPQAAKRGLLGYVQRHNPIVATNGKLIVTRAHVQNMWAAQNYVAELAGQKPSYNTTLEEDVQFVAKMFTKMDPAEQQAIADSELRLVKLVMVSKDKMIYPAVMSDIRKNLHSSKDLHRVTRMLEATGDQYVRAINRINNQLDQFGSMGAKMGTFAGLTAPGNRP